MEWRERACRSVAAARPDCRHGGRQRAAPRPRPAARAASLSPPTTCIAPVPTQRPRRRPVTRVACRPTNRRSRPSSPSPSPPPQPPHLHPAPLAPRQQGLARTVSNADPLPAAGRQGRDERDGGQAHAVRHPGGRRRRDQDLKERERKRVCVRVFFLGGGVGWLFFSQFLFIVSKHFLPRPGASFFQRETRERDERRHMCFFRGPST